MPKTLVRIGNRAFKCDLSEIRSLKLPSALQEIGDEAFYNIDGYSKIKTLTIPNKVKRIGKRAFYGWKKLQKAKLGKALESIGEGTFGNCVNLQTVEGGFFKNNMIIDGKTLVAAIGEWDKFVLPEEIEIVGDFAFSSCHEDDRFYSKDIFGPAEIILHEGVRRIGSHAFRGTRLQSLTIPESVEEIGSNPILCPAKRVEGKWTYENRAIIIGNRLCGHVRIADSYSIPEGIETLDDYAFFNCRNQGVMKFPSTIRNIGNSCFYFAQWIKVLELNEGLVSIGNNAFLSCDSLTEAAIPYTVKFIGEDAFRFCNMLTLLIFKGINPPECQGMIVSDDFNGIFKVPTGSVEAYRKEFPEMAKPTPAYPNGRIIESK